MPDHSATQSLLGADQPGTYSYGSAGRIATWDGEAWTGKISRDDEMTAVPFHRRLMPFIHHLWFWLAAGGVVLVFAADAAADSTGNSRLGWLALLGYALAMSSAVLIFTRHWGLRLRHLRESIILWGLCSGLVAVVVALVAEMALGPIVRSHPWLNGLTTGALEEVAKLIVPVALLALGRNRFSAPRVGVVLAGISGAVFGFAEGAVYQFAQSELVFYSERIFVEFLHPFLSILAAAVIWLAARRSNRTFTVAGLVGLVFAAGIHGLHDAVIFAFHTGRQSASATAIEVAAGYSAIYAIVIVVLFLCTRVTARELVPPSRIADSPPGWRPRIHQWGVRPN